VAESAWSPAGVVAAHLADRLHLGGRAASGGGGAGGVTGRPTPAVRVPGSGGSRRARLADTPCRSASLRKARKYHIGYTPVRPDRSGAGAPRRRRGGINLDVRCGVRPPTQRRRRSRQRPPSSAGRAAGPPLPERSEIGPELAGIGQFGAAVPFAEHEFFDHVRDRAAHQAELDPLRLDEADGLRTQPGAYTTSPSTVPAMDRLSMSGKENVRLRSAAAVRHPSGGRGEAGAGGRAQPPRPAIVWADAWERVASRRTGLQSGQHVLFGQVRREAWSAVADCRAKGTRHEHLVGLRFQWCTRVWRCGPKVSVLLAQG
jgi:hypothetical protein